MLRLFRDEEKLSVEYVPQRLPHREEELSLLKTFFSSVIEGRSRASVKVILSGSVGTGKTVLSRLFGQKAEEEAKANRVNLKYIHINCRISKTLFTILKRLVEIINAPLPLRGYSNEELMHGILDYMRDKDMYVILALDEVEILFKEEGEQPFYFLTRISEERGLDPTRLSLIFIVRNPEMIMAAISGVTESGMMHNEIHLDQYSMHQLFNIINFRASEAFYEGAVMEGSMRLIAEIASKRGDARYALELLWRAGKYAEADGSEMVYPEHVRKAAASVYPAIKRENLRYLPLHGKLMLLATTRLLQEKEKVEITSSELNEGYKVVCEEYNVTPKQYTRFWEYLQKLEDLGIVRIRVSSTGTRGRRSYISIPEVPVSIIEHEITSLLEKEGRDASDSM